MSIHDQRSVNLDRLLGLARTAFYIAVPEVENDGRIASPLMLSLGADGITPGRLFTGDALPFFLKNLKPGQHAVLAYTEHRSMVLAVASNQEVLARAAIPFSITGRRFEEPLAVEVLDVFDPSYSHDRVLQHLLPLEGLSGASGDVDPDSMDPVFMPDTAQTLQDMVRISELHGGAPKGTTPGAPKGTTPGAPKGTTPGTPPTTSSLEGLEPERHADASLGLLAVWVDLCRTLGEQGPDKLAQFGTELGKANSPVLRTLYAGADLDDSMAASRLRTEASDRTSAVGSLRAAFAFVEGGEAAHQELIAVLRSVLGTDPAVARAIDGISQRLDLGAVKRGFVRSVVWMLIFVGLVLVCGGYACFG